MMHPSQRIQGVQTPVIPVVAELLRAHPEALSLGQGIVHYGPPPSALARLAEAMADPAQHRYAHVAGLPALVARLADKLRDENGIDVGGDGGRGAEVVVTAGANMGFMNAVLAVADPGDEVILPRPYYFNHEMAVALAGCRAVPVETDAAYGLRLDAIERALTPRTRAVVTVSPNNPTGAVYAEEALRAVNALCRDRGLYHVSDEAYEYFTYDGARAFSPASIDGAAGHTLSLYSLSKAYGFAGWRIGYMVVPAGLLPSVKKIQDTILICPPVPSQHAALGALEAGAAYARAHVAELAGVRALVRAELSRLGDRITVPEPRGAFYFFVRIHTTMDATTLVRRLVEEHGVAAIPGDTFGATDGCYLRLSYGALRRDTVAEALRRLVAGLSDLV